MVCPIPQGDHNYNGVKAMNTYDDVVTLYLKHVNVAN